MYIYIQKNCFLEVILPFCEQKKTTPPVSAYLHVFGHCEVIKSTAKVVSPQTSSLNDDLEALALQAVAAKISTWQVLTLHPEKWTVGVNLEIKPDFEKEHHLKHSVPWLWVQKCWFSRDLVNVEFEEWIFKWGFYCAFLWKVTEQWAWRRYSLKRHQQIASELVEKQLGKGFEFGVCSKGMLKRVSWAQSGFNNKTRLF